MSTWLYQWGKTAFGRPWLVIAAWLVVVASVAGALVVAPPQLSSEIRIDGTPAQQVIDNLARDLPEASGGQGLIAFEAPEGSSFAEPAVRDALTSAVGAVYSADHVIDAREILAAEAAKGERSQVLATADAVAQADAKAAAAGGGAPTGPPALLVVDGQPVPGVLLSADGKAAIFQFQFDEQVMDLPTGTIPDVVEAAQEAVGESGVQVLPSQSMLEIPELVGVGEAVGLLLAGLVLLLTLGSVVAAGLPLGIALTGVGVGVGGAFALSHVFEIHSLAAVLALMLGLAVGIDYALFIVNRQRRLVLAHGLTAREAAGRALGTAGSAVVFAGLTVIIALLALLVVDIQVLSTMAVIAAGTVLVVVAAALTLLPAMLGVVGERICHGRERARVRDDGEDRKDHRVAKAWAVYVSRRPWLVALAAVAVAGVMALPAADMRLGLPSGASYDADTPQRQSHELVASTFAAGYNGPLVISATAAGDVPLGPATVAGVAAELRSTPGVASVRFAGQSTDGATAVLTVVPTTGPDDPETADLVERIRERSGELRETYGVSTGVTGFAALGIDVSDRLADALPVYLAVVAGLSLVVLLLVFRSVVVPLKATAGFLLSVGSAFGVTTAVFQWGWAQELLGMDATGPLLSLLPIILVGVLYGLAMDYEVFLVSSMKEAHVHGVPGKQAVVQGFAQSSRVVVAAAIIMVSVFAGFVFNADPSIKQFGFALAAGVLVDAFLVRMTLVPAVMVILGDRAWWLPRWLDRLLPNLDVEGDALVRRLASRAPMLERHLAAVDNA